MVVLTKFGMIMAVVAVTSIAAISVPTIVSAQNMTENMTSGQNTTADIDQMGSVSSRSGVNILPRH
jgi:phosphohistidine swiveling domain-containing protein